MRATVAVHGSSVRIEFVAENGDAIDTHGGDLPSHDAAVQWAEECKAALDTLGIGFPQVTQG